MKECQTFCSSLVQTANLFHICENDTHLCLFMNSAILLEYEPFVFAFTVGPFAEEICYY